MEQDNVSLFISYRNADTGELATSLSKRLAKDLGAAAVFRDKSDLIGGEPWSSRLDQEIRSATATLFLVGPEWVGPPDQPSRLAFADDPVRSEVQTGLDSPTWPIPVLVDIDSPPEGLPGDVAPLFDRHAIRAKKTTLGLGLSKSYQSLLVAAWRALLAASPGSVLILGGETALADIELLVATMKDAKRLDAKKLTRFASGAMIVTPRRAKHGNRRWPDVIVLADEPSDSLTERLDALAGYPELSTVVTGAAAAAFAGFAGASIVPQTSALVSSLPTNPGTIAGAVGSAGTGTKVAVAAVAATAAVTTAVIVSDDDPAFAESTTIAFAQEGDDDDRFFPLGTPGDATVLLEPANGTGVRSVQVRLADGSSYELGDVEIPDDFSRFRDQTDGRYSVDAASVTLDDARLDGLAIEDFCFLVDDPRDAVGGWRLTGSDVTIAVNLGVRIENGSATSTIVTLEITGEAEREWVVEPDPATDTSRCPVTARRNLAGERES